MHAEGIDIFGLLFELETQDGAASSPEVMIPGWRRSPQRVDRGKLTWTLIQPLVQRPRKAVGPWVPFDPGPRGFSGV